MHEKLKYNCLICKAAGVPGAGAAYCVHNKLKWSCSTCSHPELAQAAVDASGLGEFGDAAKEVIETLVVDFVHKSILPTTSMTIAKAIESQTLALYAGKGTPTTLEGDQCEWLRNEDIDWVSRKSSTIYTPDGGPLKKSEAKNIFTSCVVFRSDDPRKSFFAEAAIHREMERVAAETNAPRGVVATRAVGAGNKADWLIKQAMLTDTPIVQTGVFITYAPLEVRGDAYYHDDLKVSVHHARLGHAKLDCLLTQSSPANSLGASPTETPSESEDEDVVRDLEGQTFHFTGTVPGRNRRSLKRRLTNRGAKCTEGTRLPKRTNQYMLVIGDQPSQPKIADAEKCGATLMPAAEFVEKYL